MGDVSLPVALSVLLGCYLVGAVPVGVLVGFRHGIDIRQHGSGNIGFTNVLRLLGWKAGVSVFLCDVAKGAAPSFLTWRLWRDDAPWLAVGGGLMAVLGHSFSVFLRFRGGKGIATALGAGTVMHPLAPPLGWLIWGMVLVIFRYVSLASIVGVWAAAALFWAFGCRFELVMWGVAAGVISTVKHYPNIRRLLDGTEPKVGRSRK